MSVIPSDIAYYGSYCDPVYDGSSTLSASISSSTATSLSVNSASSFPSSGEFFVLVDSEIMLVTQVSGTTFTVIRGMCGTTATTHSSAANITMPAGGGIDILAKVAFSDVTSGDKADYVSSSTSDTLVQIALTGRSTAGVIQTETETLNGQTVVNGALTWDRFLSARLAAGTTTTAQITSGGTTLAVTGHASFPTSGNYNIQVGREIMTVTAGQNTNSWTVTRGVGGTTATVHQSGDNVYLVPAGDVAVVDHTAVVSAHTAQTGSANSTGTTPALIKLQSGDGSSVSVGQVILTTSGTGSHQIRTIIATSGYGTDVVAVSRNWGTVPDNTTVYTVYNGMQLDLAPNQVVECRRFLANAAADIPGGSTHTFYQQVFAMNNNTSVAFTGATVEVASDSPSLPGSAALDLATATAQNDQQYVATRQTAFSSGYGSFVVQPSNTAYGANSGNLASGAAPNTGGAQGIILRMTLPAGTTSYKGAASLQSNGNTI
jgi:hypothetical protein